MVQLKMRVIDKTIAWQNPKQRK